MELDSNDVLVAHERTKSYEAGWYMGRFKLFRVFASWKKACPSASFLSFLVKFTKRETNKTTRWMLPGW